MKNITLSTLPILDDFDLYLTFLRSHDSVPVTNSNNHLKQADLFRINEEMHFKAAWVTAKSMQPHYPLLNFFYQVVIAGGLARVHHEKKGIYLRINPGQLEKYDLMTRTERYFFLLESLWCHLNWEELTGARSLYFAETIFELLRLAAESAPGQAFEVQDRSIYDSGGRKPVHVNCNRSIYEVFRFLGFYDMEPDTSLTKKPDSYAFPYKAIIAQELSQHLVPVLLEQRPLPVWNLRASQEPDMFGEFESIANMLSGQAGEQETVPVQEFSRPVEPFIEAFKPLFAPGELSEDFYAREENFIGGRYSIKVSLSRKLYRTIAIGASATLEDLHLAIQEAYKFDDDHLYAFYMDGKAWSDAGFYDRRGERGPFTDEVRLGELNLYAGKQFLYLFDFGDCWEFKVLVQKIEQQMPEPDKASIVEEKGEAPEQYMDYQGEDDW